MKKLSLLTIVLVILIISMVFILKNKVENITYTGYLIRNWETLYLAPNFPLVGNDDAEKIWVKNENQDWESSLK